MLLCTKTLWQLGACGPSCTEHLYRTTKNNISSQQLPASINSPKLSKGQHL